MNETRSHSDVNGADDVPHYSNRKRGRHRRRQRQWTPPRPQPNGDVRPMLLDTWALAETVLKRWYWLILGGLIVAGLGAFAGWSLWQPYYVATGQLIRFEQQNSAEFFKYQQITQPTFVSILESPDLIERVSRKVAPGISPDDLKGRLLIAPERESDIVAIQVMGETPERAVGLANAYVTNAIEFFREMQRREAANDNLYLTKQLEEMDQEVTALNIKLRAAPGSEAAKVVGPNSLAERLSKAQDDLDSLLTKFTEQHPDVIAKRRDIARLQTEVKKLIDQSGLPQKNAPGGADQDIEILRSQISMLTSSRILLHTRQREAKQFSENPPGYCRVFAMAELKDVAYVDPKMKIGFLGFVGGVGGVGGVIILILLFELLDNRLKTVNDLKRVTKLPVIATLGDLDKMHPSAQASWAFRTWTALQSRLSLSPNHGLVCGFTSSGGGQGRSTWIRLLAKAASQCGFRVLTIATLPSPPFMQEDQKDEDDKRNHSDMNGHDTPSPFGSDPSMAVANNVLSTPAEVTEKLTGDNPQPLVHIPLPGWVWSLERRKQWQSALKQWRNIENIVILVELPPACDPEAVLLAENIPNVIWLSDGSKADASDSREQLQTLRDARCNLVGTVMNRAPAATRIRKRFSRWVGLWPLLACISLASFSGRAQDNAPATPAPPASANAVTNEPVFSAAAATRRAEWQKRLTLGPGDTLNISMYGQPELARLDVMVGPDGRLTYLQAMEIPVAGLTVDEVRAKLDEELGQFYRSPRTIVVPTAYKSKKYYVLGKVVNKGVFTLDRPTTILEAVARARGLETGLLDNQNTFDLADLSRSFVMRGNKRLDVNLEKLFFEGDLTQNVPLEPEDYLYFAAGNLKEVYVLGHVRNPGPVIHTPSLTVVGAIAARLGYTDKAFKSRVLVVRGSLNKPKTFVVDTWAALDARGLDFKLEPKDIVYIHARPFIRAEEILDLAATAFLQSMTASWANAFIGPIIKNPILPQQ